MQKDGHLSILCTRQDAMVHKPKLLDQVRNPLRRRHYSIRTEEASFFFLLLFLFFPGPRPPREMGAPEVEAFLTHLAVNRQVAASTQNQASATRM